VAEFNRGHTCLFSIHIEHRGHRIKKALDSRRAHRQSRRSRKTRYRAPRFLNRTRPQGWLPPSLMSRVHHVDTWTKKLIKTSPIDSANVETVRFDPQLMVNPKIKGVEYQQGTLMDWKLREYLLVRHRHTCAYCDGLTGDAILEKEHVLPRSLGGTNQVSNLVIACRTCNQHKGHLLPKAWGERCGTRKNKIDQQRSQSMAKILLGIRPSLRDAAAVNATRYAVGRVIKDRIAQTQFWSGGRTKKNRTAQHYPKAHWIDAACVGETGHQVTLEHADVLTVSAKGHGPRQMCRMDQYGFPRTSAKASRSVKGFKTGDIVIAHVTQGKKQGFYQGRVAVRSSGSFNITSGKTVVQGIRHQYCRLQHRGDGYGYSTSTTIATHERSSEKQAA